MPTGHMEVQKVGYCPVPEAVHYVPKRAADNKAKADSVE